MRKLLFSLICFYAVSVSAASYTIESVPNPKIGNNSSVSNPDNILSEQTVQELNAMIDGLNRTNGSEVAVVVLESIGDRDIESFSTELFAKWGVGTKKNNNGLLLLFVLDQKKIRFETGYGLEGVLPDAICKRIQTQEMIPEFKKGDFDEGMLKGVSRIVGIVKGEKFDNTKKSIAWSEIVPYAIGIYFLLFMIALVWIIRIVGRIKADQRIVANIAKYKAIKSESNAVLGIIAVGIPALLLLSGILFRFPFYIYVLLIPVPFVMLPVLLITRLLMTKVRRQSIRCNECGGTMHILSEKKEDKYLSLSQQFEEQLSAIDYDVFLCDACNNEAIFTLDKPSAYSECPKCKTKAFILKEKRTIIAPTYISPGTERVTYHCKYCGYEEHDNHQLPRLDNTGSAFVGGAVAGSMFSGRGGFGGGGGFSGGSFGGGMSGGGGSSSGW